MKNNSGPRLVHSLIVGIFGAAHLIAGAIMNRTTLVMVLGIAVGMSCITGFLCERRVFSPGCGLRVVDKEHDLSTMNVEFEEREREQKLPIEGQQNDR